MRTERSALLCQAAMPMTSTSETRLRTLVSVTCSYDARVQSGDAAPRPLSLLSATPLELSLITVVGAGGRDLKGTKDQPKNVSTRACTPRGSSCLPIRSFCVFSYYALLTTILSYRAPPSAPDSDMHHSCARLPRAKTSRSTIP